MIVGVKKNEISIATCEIKVAINDEIRYKADLETDKQAAYSLARNYKVLDLTVDELKDHIKARHNIAPIGYDEEGYFHRSKADFRQTQVVGVDFDNPAPERYVTFDEALEHSFIKQYAAILYETASSIPTHNRFRPLYILPHPVTDHTEIDEIILAFMWKHSDALDADESCKDRSRFFYGAKENGRIVVCNYEPMSELTLADLLTEYRAAMDAVKPKATEKAETVQLPQSFSDEAAGRGRQYGERALEAARQIINNSCAPQASATGKIPGNRHNARLRTGRLLGGYVAGGMLTVGEVESLMPGVIMANTNNYTSAMKTFRDALYFGMQTPITFEQKEKERTEFLSHNGHIIFGQSIAPVLQEATIKSEKNASVFDDIILLVTSALEWNEEDKLTLIALFAVFGGRKTARVSATTLASRIKERSGVSEQASRNDNQFGRRRLSSLRKTLKRTINYSVLRLVEQGGAKAGINKRTGKPFPSKWALDMKPFSEALALSEDYLSEWNAGKPRFVEWRTEEGKPKKVNPGRAREKAAQEIAIQYSKTKKTDTEDEPAAVKPDNFVQWIQAEKMVKRAAIKIADILEDLGQTRLEKTHYTIGLIGELRAILVQDDRKNRRRKLRELKIVSSSEKEKHTITDDSKEIRLKNVKKIEGITAKDNAYTNDSDSLIDAAIENSVNNEEVFSIR